MSTVFKTDHHQMSYKYQSAVEGLKSNVCKPFLVEGNQLNMPVLIEGSVYRGVWLECGPLEGLIYGSLYDIEVAEANHNIFFDFQREDGYLPCWFINGKVGKGQIQMVVPIAKTAFELYKQTRNAAFLEKAYRACKKWDEWLLKYRDPRGLNLCELFCEFDTGHDNSSRFYQLCKGSYHACPEDDARICHDAGTLPWLAPDLSATLYGGRTALAAMALEMGYKAEAEYWLEKAELTRSAILAFLFDPESMCFFDLDCNYRFVRIVGDALSRVLCEHVIDQSLFEQIFKRHIINPYGFWTPYPMPSVAVSDPLFNQHPQYNSWGGPVQALTALRAPRWFEYYNKPSELTHMMKQWLKALVGSTDFSQQMNPWTGEFSKDKGYSPAMCVMIDYTARLYGIKKVEDKLEWNCRLPEAAGVSLYELDSGNGRAILKNDKENTLISIENGEKYSVKGTCRVITSKTGCMESILGTERTDADIEIVRLSDGRKISAKIRPNEKQEIEFN